MLAFIISPKRQTLLELSSTYLRGSPSNKHKPQKKKGRPAFVHLLHLVDDGPPPCMVPSALDVPQGLSGLTVSSSEAPWLDRDGGGAGDNASNRLVDLRLALLDGFLGLVMVR